MVEGAYVPGAGDIVWLIFAPQAGHEPAGRCSTLVLSPRTYVVGEVLEKLTVLLAG